MPQVSASMKFTLQVRPYESASFELGVEGIDTDAPIGPQLEASRDAIQQSCDWLEQRLYEKITESGLLQAVKERPTPKK